MGEQFKPEMQILERAINQPTLKLKDLAKIKREDLMMLKEEDL